MELNNSDIVEENPRNEIAVPSEQIGLDMELSYDDQDDLAATTVPPITNPMVTDPLKPSRTPTNSARNCLQSPKRANESENNENKIQSKRRRLCDEDEKLRDERNSNASNADDTVDQELDDEENYDEGHNDIQNSQMYLESDLQECLSEYEDYSDVEND